MTVLGIASAAASSYQPGVTSRAAQARQSFKELGSALTAGDLATAQQAFQTLQQNLPGAGRAKGQNSDPARELIQNLGSALESGNVADAQQILAKLQQGMGGIRGKGHHYGHEKQAARLEEAAGAPQPPPPAVETYSAGGLPVTAAPPAAPGGSSGEIDIQA